MKLRIEVLETSNNLSLILSKQEVKDLEYLVKTGMLYSNLNYITYSDKKNLNELKRISDKIYSLVTSESIMSKSMNSKNTYVKWNIDKNKIKDIKSDYSLIKDIIRLFGINKEITKYEDVNSLLGIISF